MGEYAKGKVLPGTKWVAGDEIGRGGMGIVLHVSKEPCILGTAKIITPELARRPDFRARFFEEARIQASLRHKHIAQVLDFDTLEDGTPFFVMERLNGKTLGQLLREGNRFEPKFVHDVMTQVLEGLYRAHTFDPPIVHRDIKPENIFVHVPEFDEPVVKILDYGIAKLLDGRGRDRGIYGTLGFSSPEQLSHGEVTTKTDLFAAGLLLFVMLAGRGPFDHYRDERRIARALLEEPAPSIRDFAPWVPEPVVEVIAAALSKEPESRPRDAYHFIAKLFSLTWAGDDRDPATSANMNTTTPDARTMATSTMVKLVEEKKPARSTVRGMTPPPVEGEPLEAAPPEIQAELGAYLSARRGDDTAPEAPSLMAERAALPGTPRRRPLAVLRGFGVALLPRWLRSASPMEAPRPAAMKRRPEGYGRMTERLDLARPEIDRGAPTRTMPRPKETAVDMPPQPSTPGGTSRSLHGFGAHPIRWWRVVAVAAVPVIAFALVRLPIATRRLHRGQAAQEAPAPPLRARDVMSSPLGALPPTAAASVRLPVAASEVPPSARVEASLRGGAERLPTAPIASATTKPVAPVLAPSNRPVPSSGAASPRITRALPDDDRDLLFDPSKDRR